MCRFSAFYLVTLAFFLVTPQMGGWIGAHRYYTMEALSTTNAVLEMDHGRVIAGLLVLPESVHRR
jgi:hypothetical protein